MKSWAGHKVHVASSIKDTFLIFTNDFIELGVWSMSSVLHVVERALFSMSQLDRYQLHLAHPTLEHRPARNLLRETCKPF